jgi:hypothetical protein
MGLRGHEAEVFGLPHRRKRSPRIWRAFPNRRSRLLALFLVGSTVLATPASAALTVGVGTAACVDWTTHRHMNGDGGVYKDQQWILGFLAGMRFAQMPEAPPRAVNADDLWAIVDDYCEQNPTDRLEGAAVYFYRNHAR